MKSAEVLYSKGANDECYTPRYAVEPIVKHLPYGLTVWCPFDTADSEFVKVLLEKGFNVCFSHISHGKDFDFFTWEPEYWDVMISNPPFTGKRKIFERALLFNKPFALMCTLTWLNDAAPKQLFANRDLQLLMFDKRIHFKGEKKITFSSAYYCCDFLPKQIIMEKLNVSQHQV
jgi:hypothetical protein